MQRINFTAEDIARLCVTRTVTPMIEALFALELIDKIGNGPFGHWRKRVFAQLGPHAENFRVMASLGRPIPDLLWLLGTRTALDNQRLRALGLVQRDVTEAMSLFCRVAVTPYWPTLHAYLEAERDLRTHIIANGGADQLLRTLHPDVHWRTPVLEIPANHGPDIDLLGRGLTVMPSVFQWSRPAVLIQTGPYAAHPVLVFAAAPNGSGAADLLTPPASPARILEPLLGRTRTAVLRALSEARTTTDLANWLSISAAGASQHATVLRRTHQHPTVQERGLPYADAAGPGSRAGHRTAGAPRRRYRRFGALIGCSRTRIGSRTQIGEYRQDPLVAVGG